MYDTKSVPEKYKIGVTKNDVKFRKNHLQTGSSGEIVILRVYESDMYIKIETILHRRFSHLTTDGGKEWFTLSNDRALNFLSECKSIEDDLNLLKSSGNPFI